MIGIVLAGGTGSRLWPVTFSTSKQLLPIFDKPLIYYPINTLMSAGIKEIVIITTPHDQNSFRNLLGTGSDLGVTFHYEVQKSPDGLAQAFLLAKNYILGRKVCLILGDNLFHGVGLGNQLAEYTNISGAQIFAYRVSDPERYGVVEFSSDGTVVSIEEKPKLPRSTYAIPGLYFFDEEVLGFSLGVQPSPRGELEISSVIQNYLDTNSLKVKILPRGTAWLDTGTFASMNDASILVRTLEERQGTKIACLEETAYRNGWISRKQLEGLAARFKGGDYGKYLAMVAEENK